jgi:hypothetical protein
VVEAQRGSQQAIENDLMARLAILAKVKLTCVPRRIEDPVDQIAFSLRVKGREPLDLVADWSTDRLTFMLPDGWEDDLTSFLVGSGRRRATRAARAAKAAVAPRLAGGVRRRAIGLVAAAVVVACLVGTWAFWPSDGPPPTPTDEPGATEHSPKKQPPVVEPGADDSASSNENATEAESEPAN